MKSSFRPPTTVCRNTARPAGVTSPSTTTRSVVQPVHAEALTHTHQPGPAGPSSHSSNRTSSAKVAEITGAWRDYQHTDTTASTNPAADRALATSSSAQPRIGPPGRRGGPTR